jgi:3-oxoacyl-[acyl-carrier protein] reductase
MSLDGKRAIVTGASRGIGRAIANSLAAEGVKTFITARNKTELVAVVNEINERGGDISFVSADLSDSDQIEAMFDKAIGFLGGIDILINNAGIGVHGPALNLSPALWDDMFAVNLKAPFLITRLAAPLMVAQKSGFIINIGSGASQTPIANYAAYCATKYGLLGYSESLALELREYNIKVSMILPGSTATYFSGSTPEERLSTKPGILRPEDIADSVLYLLKQSPQAWTSVMNLRPLNLNKI